MIVTNIRHAGIVVSDMERSLRFYRELVEILPPSVANRKET